MSHPLLYEINTRCWLDDLSVRQGKRVTLSAVPESEFQSWKRLGFTHIWLMGVWRVGTKVRERAIREPNLKPEYTAALPGWHPEDVTGSPYAIAEYQVCDRLGGETGLRRFWQTLRQHGMKLVLDFIPNHVGLDHPWVAEHPEYFVQLPTETPGTFAQQTEMGVQWLAHGKDPYFAPWDDTVQLDYRRVDTRRAMLNELQSVAQHCDGVRCDTAMLVLNDVFARTWSGAPFTGPHLENEFWSGAVPAVKERFPGFLLLAEVYWDLEQRLQDLGFDFTYDKGFYDHLVARNNMEAIHHLYAKSGDFLDRSAHFLENHDERRIASSLDWPEHRAAAGVLLGLPGMRLIHEGQLSGATVRLPVQLGRRAPHPPDTEITRFYSSILEKLQTSAVGSGQWQILKPEPAAASLLVCIQWQAESAEFDVIAVNLSDQVVERPMKPTVDNLHRGQWRVEALLGGGASTVLGFQLVTEGHRIVLPPHGLELFQFHPSA